MAITKEQLEFRKGKIGASNAAAALGISPWQSPANLFHTIKGNLEPFDIGAKGRIGNAIEPVIIQEYEIETGIKVTPSPDTLIHPEYEWMICHLDGEMPDHGKILEIKNVGWTVAHQWGLDGDPTGIPHYVRAQCVHQSILADVELVDVAAFFGGNELRVYPLKIEKDEKEAVLGGLLAFWNDYIVPNKQPELTAKDLDLLKELYANPKKLKTVEVDSTATAIMFQDYRNVKDSLKEMEGRANLYKAKIQEFMGDAEILMRGEDQEFTWKQTKDKVTYDWQLIAGDYREELEYQGMPQEDLSNIEEKHRKVTPGHRVFLDKFK